jgi:HEAT repeat protein
LGNYRKIEAEDIFVSALADQEVNIRWDAAVALAKIKNNRGSMILLDLLDRNYLDSFPNIDPLEQDQAMLVAIQVIPNIIDAEFESMLRNLRDNDRSMKVREAARRALNE